MRKLRDRWIYTLPNGKVFVARAIGPESYFLHSTVVDLPVMINYSVDCSGRIMQLRGQAISWRIEDLSDTGQTFTEAREISESEATDSFPVKR